ncbi:hypothetical protein Tco_1211456 [Tanacetum coccineum]
METEVESMVTVPIQQVSSSVPLLILQSSISHLLNQYLLPVKNHSLQLSPPTSALQQSSSVLEMYYNLPPRTVSPDPVAIVASRAVDPVGSPSSTTIDQDEQSTSTSPTNQEIQSQVTHQGPVPQFMAPDHSSSGPVLHEMTSDQIRSDLTPNRQETSVDNISSDLVSNKQKAIFLLSAAFGSAQPPSKDDHQSSKKPRESDASASKQHPALTSTGWQITDTRDDVVNSLMHMLPNNIQITDTNSFIVSKKRSSDSSKKLKGIQTLTPAEQEAADIMKALKESKKMSKRQPGTGGSNEGTGNILGVPDESTVISRASSEGTGSKPGVPDEEKLIL